MTRSEFILLHTEAIMALDDVDAKKQELAASLFQFLLLFDSKEISFHIDDVAKQTGLDLGFLNQPHDTYKNPSYAAPLMDMFGLSDILVDENKYQSLLESALVLLMTAQLEIYPGKYFVYSILSSITKADKKDEFFSSDFTVTFTENFLTELNAVK